MHHQAVQTQVKHGLDSEATDMMAARSLACTRALITTLLSVHSDPIRMSTRALLHRRAHLHRQCGQPAELHPAVRMHAACRHALNTSSTHAPYALRDMQVAAGGKLQ